MTPEEELQNQRETLMILEVIIQAIDRHEEVFQAIENTESHVEALAALKELLGVGDMRARVVLDMQVRRFTVSERRNVEEQISLLKQEIGALD
ncbi:DNA gyrase subunit A [Arthrobacter sp. MYb227]|uniref:DNA gyrase subunit A n=1 Tax=Arthrobacter sp. MYb227 TaxID=1848601 RepID=UPI000CFDE72F|nr:DNA gyrase subunit A [Arthrobacter sp. MYb227]PQZ90297.1 DNA gyrase subunit A [Arthrobacter sp. MYb227]